MNDEFNVDHSQTLPDGRRKKKGGNPQRKEETYARTPTLFRTYSRVSVDVTHLLPCSTLPSRYMLIYLLLLIPKSRVQTRFPRHGYAPPCLLHRTPHGGSRIAHATSVWSVKTGRSPSRHYRGSRINGLETTAMVSRLRLCMKGVHPFSFLLPRDP